jgi:hypothetical protein
MVQKQKDTHNSIKVVNPFGEDSGNNIKEQNSKFYMMDQLDQPGTLPVKYVNTIL